MLSRDLSANCGTLTKKKTAPGQRGRNPLLFKTHEKSTKDMVFDPDTACPASGVGWDRAALVAAEQQRFTNASRNMTPPDARRRIDEVTDPLDGAEIERRARELELSDAARELHKKRTLDEAAAKRLANYPDYRRSSTYQDMKNPAKLADPIIWDPESGAIVQRAGHTARLLADGKGGKTSVGLEWCRSALTGEPWLGHFSVKPIEAGGWVAFLDPELDSDFSWYAEQAFGDLGPSVVDRLRRVDLVELKAQGWTWAAEADRNWLADQIMGSERLFADSILSLLPGGGGSGRAEASHSLDAVGEFLDQLKAFQKRAGVQEILVGIHRPSGGAEKSFGSIQWDAKFQALWSIKVEENEDGTQTRRLRGMPGRAGTKFVEREIVQADGKGRVKYLVPTLASSAAAHAASDAAARAALEPALRKFAEVLQGLWAEGIEPGKQAVVDAINQADGHRLLSNKQYGPFWDEIEHRKLATIKDGSRNKKIVCLP